MMWAYNVKSYQVVKSPALVEAGNAAYDVAAKAEGNGVPTQAEFRAMLQVLLADRFALQLHREMRDTPVYALTVAKNAPKFQEVDPDDTGLARTNVGGRNYVVTIPHATMDLLTDLLQNAGLDRPVVDRTGLTKSYSIKLTYTPETRNHRAEPDPGDVSIFTALQEQLGLKLVPQTAPIEHLVVDRASKPTSN